MLPMDIIFLITILVIFISTCDVLCKSSHNRWPCGLERDGEGYKVISGFAGENGDTDGYGEDGMGGVEYGGGSNEWR